MQALRATLRWRLCVALLCACASTSLRASSNVVSTVVIDDDRIVISVPIAVVGGSAELIERWKRGIEQSWNRGNNEEAFRVCGRAVVFDAQFTFRRSPEASSRSAHLVIVEDVPPGETHVSRVWHALGTSPADSIRTGFWGSNADGATAAHEFGHLLGLFDEYVESERGMRAPGERPVPNEARYPDAWRSLMAQEHGSVLERHVREVVRIHGAPQMLSCER
jgi:hypothetical protein